MSRFTENEFETALGQVYPYSTWKSHFSEECKTFLKDILTSDPAKLDEYIGNISKSDNEAMIKCINSIMGSTEINDLTKFIKYIHQRGINSDNISETMQQGPEYNSPIFRMSEKMLQNQEQRPLPSERPLASARHSALPSARPLEITIAKPAKPRIARQTNVSAVQKKLTPLSQDDIETYKQQADYNDPDNWYTQSPKNILQYYIHKRTNLVVTPDEYRQIVNIQRGGGSRRRRSSHRKRKSYRKSKRVRHTRRKQTRRHRHRRSRHRR
jgi:hypothetical protein